TIGIGRYAVTHNHIVDRAVSDNNWVLLIKEVNKGRQAFQELYDNILLSEEDKNRIIALLDLELATLMSVVNNYNVNTTVPLLSRQGDNRLTLYDKCREIINVVNNDVPSTGQLSDVVWLSDVTSDSLLPEIRCYNVDMLLL